MKKEQNPKRKMTSKQIAAITGIVLLVLLYLISLAAAILDSSSAAVWFRASLFGTIALPLLIWIYVWLYGKMTGRHTIADAPDVSESENHSVNTSGAYDLSESDNELD